MASIYLVRHGQAGFGLTNYDVLTDLGVKQAQTLGNHFANISLQPDEVVCGDMTRHRLTRDNVLAQLTGDWHSLPENPLWNEFNHEEVLSVFDQRFATPEKLMAELKASPNSKAFFVQQFGQAIARWTSGDFNSDYSEPWQDFNNRVNQGLEQLVAQIQPKQKVMVFTSGGVISTILMKLMNIPHAELLKLNMNIANASVTELKVNQFGVMVHTFNDYSALRLASLSGEQQLVTFA